MLAAGTTLGPYRILAPLGAGGMGEVYRARDPRLGRDVALKVIPGPLARDPGRIARFEQEARAASALSHPNVCAIYDFGTHEGTPYVVMELLEGESLRARLAHGAVPARKAIDFAAQAAHGLAAAHEKGIVHRDLKPENLFVTKDGRVKVLDFGLAKLTRPVEEGASQFETLSAVDSDPGVLLGTVGYMSPEQVRGGRTDHHSDLFALGATLYELLTGRQAFRRESYVETLNAILKEDPPPLSASGREIPPALEPIVRRCLEKSPAERFQSASDLAFALEALSGSGTSGRVPAPPEPRGGRWRAPAAALALLGVVAMGAWLAGRNTARSTGPAFERVTYRRGYVNHYARFTPDGQSVLYGATYVGDSNQIYTQRLASPDARPLGLAGWVIATAGGEMAVLRRGVLSRVPLEGGTPRELVERVSRADWSRDGRRFLVVRYEKDSLRLECPPGTVVLSDLRRRLIDTPRFSPRGDRIAFVRLLSPESDLRGEVVVTDLAGRQKVLSRGWTDIDGLAWSPDGREVWFTATRSSRPPALWAVTPGGKERLLAAFTGTMKLCDVAPDGRVLFAHLSRRFELRGRTAADSAERDLSWLDATLTGYLSPDGRQLVFQEAGEGARNTGGATYHRRMDGSAPVRLADCVPYGVSPDWKWVLGMSPGADASAGGRLSLVPIGAGDTRELPKGPIERYTWADFSPAGDVIVIRGNEAGRPMRRFLQKLDGSPPRPLDTEVGVFSADGRWYAARPPGARAPFAFFPVEGGAPRAIPGLKVDDDPLLASADGRTLFVARGLGTRAVSVARLDLAAGARGPWRAVSPPDTTASETPFQAGDDGRSFYFMRGLNSGVARIARVDLPTGVRRPWLALAPPDPVGMGGIEAVMLTPDGRHYTYCYKRELADLYVMSRPR